MPAHAPDNAVKQGRSPCPEDVAHYIGEICLELRVLANGARLEMLTHILDMAVEEAQQHSRH